MSASQRSIVTDSIGVGLATGLYGISYGVIATTSGLSVLQACVTSLLVFTGGSQFALVGVVGAGGNPITGGLTAILLGSRNMFYGLSLTSKLRLTRRQRLAAAHLVIDESTAMSVMRETTREARLGFFWTGLAVFTLWNLFTLVGALAGERLGDPRTYGLDAAVGAAFLGLIWPRLNTWFARAVAVGAAAAALALVPFTAAGVPIMAGGALAVLLGLAWGGRR